MCERVHVAVLAFVGFIAVSCLHAEQHVTSGPELDYQAAILRSSDDGARIVVFERLDPSTVYGDLWLTRSTDGGETWTEPAPIVASRPMRAGATIAVFEPTKTPSSITVACLFAPS